jgi:hypothetical protein
MEQVLLDVGNKLANASPPPSKQSLSAEQLLMLEKLKGLVEEDSVDANSFIYELKQLPGTEALVRALDNYAYASALREISNLTGGNL